MHRKICTFIAVMAFVILSAGCAFGVEINEENFPDPALREFVKQYDIGERRVEGSPLRLGEKDGILSSVELSWVTGMNAPGTNLKGIEHFTALDTFGCRNNGVTELDVSSFSRLGLLNCDFNKLKKLNVSNNPALYHLHCLDNQIEALDVSHNPELIELMCNNNPIGKLDVSNNLKLEILVCGSTDLRELDVTNNLYLTRLDCYNNHLTELDLSKNTALTEVLLGVQEADGLKVKAVPEGYEVCLNDYVSDVNNIDIFRVGANDYSMRFTKYSNENGKATVIFPEPPKTLHYFYDTRSPNNDQLYVVIKRSLNVDVIERGGPKDNIIFGVKDNCYLDENDKAITEKSIADLSAKIYGKKGFVADGNSRLIVRVKTERPGNVEFSVKENIGVEIERLSDRAKVSSIHTTDIGGEEHQASAVLVAPEMYPVGIFPSQDFTVHVKFTADETEEETPEDEKVAENDIELEIHAAPVVLLHGFSGGANAESTFGINENIGVYRKLKDAKFNVSWWNYDGTKGPSVLLRNDYNGLFSTLVLAFEEYRKKGIVCTKADIVGYSMGGLVARYFCLPQQASFDGNYYTFRSYKQGMVRRIIDIAVPNKGSPWASYFCKDFSVINTNINFLAMSVSGWLMIAEPVIKKAVEQFMNGGRNSDSAWEDMAINSAVTGGAYPVNVPMYSIYGQIKQDIDKFMKTYDYITFLNTAGKYAVKYSKTDEYIDYLDKFKDNLDLSDKSLALFSDIAPVHPLFTSVLQAVQLALSTSPAGIVKSIAEQLPTVINEAFFANDEHDLCVSQNSAAGDFSGASSAKTGLFQYNHLAICKQNDIGNDIVSKLKGSKSAFKVFGKLSSSSPTLPLAKSPIPSDTGNDGEYDPDTTYAENFKIQLEPATLNVKAGNATLKIKATSSKKIIDGANVYIVIQKDGLDRILTAYGTDGKNFTKSIEFTSADAGSAKVYCFSYGEGQQLYISNKVQLAIKANANDSDIEELYFAGDSGVMFAESGSDIPAGLYARTKDGFAFDVSSPLMGTSWTSSNPSVAYVSSDGMIHSLADGSATLTASYAGLTASIIVNVGNNFSAPEITSQALDGGNVGKNYTAQLQASGTPLISWRIIEGRLPFDLTLSDSGMISGYPSEEGTFTFTAEASNIFGTDSKDFTITVGNAAGAAVTIDANNFPDDSFRAFISDNLDWNHDGLLTEQEIIGVTAIDVSNMGIKSLKGIEYFTALVYLTCTNNELAELDLSKNVNIYGVASQNNKLESINLANCLKLFQIWLDNNKLSSLDFADCHALNILSCKNNLITTLDLRRQANITDLQCDEGVEIRYSDTPGGSEILIDANNFPDDAFRKFIVDNFDWDKSSSLSDSEIAAITGIKAVNMGIKSLKGIEHFTALEYLTCADNELEEIDLSGNPNFIGLAANNNKLKRVNVSNNPKLYQIWVNNNKLTALDFSHNPELAIIDCSKNFLTELDISENANLRELYFVNYPDEGSEDVDYHTLQGNAIRNIDLSGATLLTHIACSANGIETLDLSNNPLLEHIECHNNYLTQIDTSIFTELKYLHVGGNKLSTLNVSQNLKLQELFCGDNLLETLTLGDKPEMFRLHCWGNNLQSLNLTECTALQELHFSSNKISAADLTNCKELVSLDCGNNLLETLTLGDKPGLLKLYCYRNNLKELNLKGCPALKELSFGANKISAVDITHCKELESLAFWDNLVTELDISEHVKLKDCIFGNNRVKTLNVGNKPELLRLHCYSNDLSAIDVTGCPVLQDFSCEGNKISVLDVTKCKELESLYCKDNLLKVLDLSECPKITTLTVDEGVKLIYTHEETPPEILTETLTNAATNQPYSLQLTASGANPLTWTLSGKLPAGLSLSEAGLISGTPTKAGKYSFTVTAENSYGKTSKPFTLEAFDPVSITTASLKAGTITKSYSVTMRAKGTKAITWSAEGLPNGLTINANGKISGKPSEYGVFDVKLKAENGAGITEKTLQLEIKAIPPTLSGTLAKPTLNVPYSSGLKLSKGSTPVTWSVEGNLPGGLSLDPNTGIISGTPTSYDKSGYKVTITASNDAGIKSKKITLKVKGTAPKITAKLPQATAGETYSAELSATGSEPITFNAELPEYLTLDGSTISGAVPDSVRSFKIKAYASNPVKKNVKKSYTIRVSAKKSLPQNQNADNGTDITEVSKGVDSEVIVNVPDPTENIVHLYSESYVIVAELGEISCDMAGIYDFEIEIPDCQLEGSELVYIANSDSPSEDDEIAEFYDDEWNEISEIPESRKITVSIWLNPGRIYMPVIAVKH